MDISATVCSVHADNYLRIEKPRKGMWPEAAYLHCDPLVISLKAQYFGLVPPKKYTIILNIYCQKEKQGQSCFWLFFFVHFFLWVLI